MKTRFLIAAACAALMVIACEQKPDDPIVPDPEDPGKTDPKPQEPQKPGPGVYKFVISQDLATKATVGVDGKTSWEAGDEILIQGGYTPDAIKVTLKASEISSDGKTASVQIDKMPEITYGSDYYYAAWPADAVDLESSTFCEDNFEFNRTDAPLMCAWLSGDTFSFQPICAALSFSVDGDFDGCALNGNKWEYVSFNSWAVQINSNSQDYWKKKGDADYFMRKDLTNGSVVLFFPGGLTLQDGFNIYLRKGDKYPKVFSKTGADKFERGTIRALGNITAQLKDYDGNAADPVVVPVMGKYEKFTVKDVSELSGICLNADKSALWAVGDNGQLAEISFDGKVTKHWSKSCGMEDVTIHPETGDLYIADEDNHRVVKISAPDYKNTITKMFTVAEATGFGNSSLEGIAYYKDDILFVGSQVGAYLWKYTISGEKLGEKISLRTLTNNAITEVGGLCWDAVNHWLWVIDSETQKMYILDEDITHVLASYRVNFAGNCESVCVDHANNCVWVGDDNDSGSRLFKIPFTGLNP